MSHGVAVVPIKRVGHNFLKSVVAARLSCSQRFRSRHLPPTRYIPLFPFPSSCFVYAAARLHPLILPHGP